MPFFQGEQEAEMQKEVLKEPIFAKEIAEIIKVSPSIEEMREQLRDYHENDIADALEKFIRKMKEKKLYPILGAKEFLKYLAIQKKIPDNILMSYQWRVRLR